MNTTTRITCGLVTATFGALALGALNGQPAFGVATVILGGAANDRFFDGKTTGATKETKHQIAIMLR